MDNSRTKRTGERIMVKKTKTQRPAPVPMVGDYIRALRRHIMNLVILPSLVLALSVACLLIITDAFSVDSPTLWAVALISGLIMLGGSFLLFITMATPINDVLRAIAHVSGEPIDGAVPNPHDTRYKKNGLGTAIQTVYQLDKERLTPTGQPTAAAPINRLNGALLALDSAHNVNYASKGAPTVTIEGDLKPELLFGEQDSLEAWLKECEQSAVKAHRFWRRIPNKPAGGEGRRLFDVYASYEKGSDHETVLTLVDMTDIYQIDEDDLNFVAFAAHELRGPITVIRGYLEVLQDELGNFLQPDHYELFYRLTISANRLSDYINNILNTARYDRRHFSLTLEPISLTEVYATIEDDMALRASISQRHLKTDIPADLPKIAADRASLSEVIGNLIDNAIKYSHTNGHIEVAASYTARDPYVALTVSDDGIGMPATVLKNLFEKFYRSHRSRESVAGTGIGLYISKAIVESHGGTITVKSEEGKGSTFTVHLPTFDSVADKLGSSGSNKNVIQKQDTSIKNHSMYRG